MFNKKENMGVTLTRITDFSCSFLKPFFKVLQQKVGCSDIIIEKIKEVFCEHIHVKIECYKGGSVMSFERGKIWATSKGRQTYHEIDDIDYLNDRPVYFWELMLHDILKDDENIGYDRISFVYDFPSTSFVLFLEGHKFEKESDSMLDLRLLEDRLLENAVLFRLKPYDFKSLEPYHKGRTSSSPDAPDFYYLTDYYRRYGNLCADSNIRKEELSKGIYWYLNLYDFTNNYLPKLDKN